MRNIIRNPEVQRTLLLQIILAAATAILVFPIDYRTGLVVLASWVLSLLIFLVSTCQRYRKIRELSEAINEILHGDNSISLENYSEGELGILHSEIYKMTVRLRDQQQRLIRDKVYLADSIADISHQIRTPLTSIHLMVQLLSEPHLPDQRRQQITRELHGLLTRIDWLITTLLKISKLDAGTVQFHQEQISLELLLRKACAPLLVPMELKGQELSAEAEGLFLGDISWTCEALGNIIKNCMEHTPEGGKIEIKASENALYTEIIIQDNGTGISKEDLPHIFERFYKGKASSDKSFGVGLALSRMIIISQKGTIKAENRQEKGAMFTIRFYKGTV